MKQLLLEPYHQIFTRLVPQTICEIGTHNAKSAVQFVDACLKLNPKLIYYGFDIFDDVKNDEQFHLDEVNGKGAGSFRTAKNNLRHRQTKNKKFKFKLTKGLTVDTLPQSKYDFVYIDGGHSYETVKYDYSMIKESKVIVFDDYQIEGVKRAFDEIVQKENITELPWEEALDSKQRCYSFMPHQRDGVTKTHGKRVSHIQPVIFNR